MSPKIVRRNLGRKFAASVSLILGGTWMYFLGLEHINAALHPFWMLPAFAAGALALWLAGNSPIKLSRRLRVGQPRQARRVTK